MKNKNAFSLAGMLVLLSLAACDGSGSGSVQAGIEGSGHQVTSSGAVSALGSIFVNDVEYDLTGAAITVDGVLARESDLDVGSLVIVEGEADANGTTGRATRVTAGIAVAGRIDSLDVARTAFTVLGQTVVVDLATKIEQAVDAQPLGGLTLGNDVAVSGFIDSSGVIRARRIGLRTAEQPLRLNGRVENLDAASRRFTVNGATVDYTNARLIGFGTRTLAGASVRVVAAELDAGNALIADEVTFREAALPGAIGSSASVQGWVTRYVSPTDFDVDGRRAVIPPGTAAVGPSAIDQFVQLRGALDADGVLRVSSVGNAAPYTFRVRNAVGDPLPGAVVTFTARGVRFDATTDAAGTAVFANVPTGDTAVTISAAGYESATFTVPIGIGSRSLLLRLQPVGAWAAGRAIVLGTSMVAKASDGSKMTFAVDMAVVDGNSEPIATLTSAAFSVPYYDCFWDGPRGCASDANGNTTGGVYTGGPALAFGWHPAESRRTYRARLLIVNNYPDAYWSEVVPALKSFLARVGGSDSISVSSVQLQGGVATHTVLGPFTNDGSLYFDAIDALPAPIVGEPGWGEPAMRQSLIDSIASVGGPGGDPNVLVLAPTWMPLPDIHAVTASAQQAGVRVSAVDLYTYGVPEIAVRTGGFVGDIGPVYDYRRLPSIIGALDPLLAGALPFYRMEFELTSEPGTFVAGGNAKVSLHVDVPFSLPTAGIWTVVDVPIE
jgi:hypothetical protein